MGTTVQRIQTLFIGKHWADTVHFKVYKNVQWNFKVILQNFKVIFPKQNLSQNTC